MSLQNYKKCYFGCVTDGTLHRFPNPVHSEERFNLWISVLDTETQKWDQQYIYNNLRLCDEHFEPFYRIRNKRLTRNAVPTLNTTPSGEIQQEQEIFINLDPTLEYIIIPTTSIGLFSTQILGETKESRCAFKTPVKTKGIHPFSDLDKENGQL